MGKLDEKLILKQKYPVFVVTGSSGAGTSTVQDALKHIFWRLSLIPLYIEGDSYHRWGREETKNKMETALREGITLSHFSPEANLLDELEQTFERYGATGTAKRRFYVHSTEESDRHGGVPPGEFTEWEEIEGKKKDLPDILCYEGLHGAYADDRIDLTKYVDVAIGVVPIVNLEWIQKIHRDGKDRGYAPEVTTQTILRRMPDYIEHITPQFSRTDINFQRVPTVDTSNPFVARDVPKPEESFVIIRFTNPRKFDVNFPNLLLEIEGSFMPPRTNTIVVPGVRMGQAMELVFEPIIENLIQQSFAKRKKDVPEAQPHL